MNLSAYKPRKIVLAFTNSFKREEERDSIIIVSGLPRSGTSMMMQMLEAGGMNLVTDNVRKPNDDNPKGYYEDERVKNIKEDASFLSECKDKAVKMVSMLLFDLPSDKKYKVIFMKRNMEEILASQSVMLRRRGREGTNIDHRKIARSFERHLRHVEEWLANQMNIEVLYVNYNDVLRNPASYSTLINQFLGHRLDEMSMTDAIEAALYRQRQD